MQAAVLHGVGEPLKLEQVPVPVPDPGEAVVKVVAASLNHRDLWIRKGQYAGLKFPAILGSDGSGVVASIGQGVDSSWVGKEVVVNPSVGWGASQATQDPRTFRILGLPDDGTFAEFVKIPAENLFSKPDYLTHEEASSLPLGGLTAFRAVSSRAQLKSGEKILITGIGGGVATLALQIAETLGGEVYVTSSSDDKLNAAEAAGAKGWANYKSEAWDADLKAQAGGFDVIVDSAGGDGFLKLIELLNPGGRLVFFGATCGDPTNFPMRRVFWKQVSILGTTMGSPDDFRQMLELFEANKLRPTIDRVFPLSQADQALDRMDQGVQSGKIVLRVSN